MEVIYLIGSVQALFSASMLLITRKTKYNKILAVWLFVLSFNLAAMYLITSRTIVLYQGNPVLYFYGFLQSMLFVPWILFYLYSATIINGETKIKPKLYLHFLPFVILNLSYVPIMFDIRNTMIRINDIRGDSPLFVHLDFWFKTIVSVLYPILVLKLLKKHKFNLKNYFSSYQEINLNWVRFLVVTWFSLSLIFIFISFMRIVFDYEVISHKTANYIIFSVYTIFVFGVSYFGYKQQPIYTTIENPERNLLDNTLYRESEANKNSKDFVHKEYLSRLDKIMTEQKPYLNKTLTIKELSEITGIPLNSLSYILNRDKQQSFFDYVNNYRVNEAKQKLRDKKFQNYKIAAVAFDSGFNSQASFFRIFKKYTGQTPAEFREDSTK